MIVKTILCATMLLMVPPSKSETTDKKAEKPADVQKSQEADKAEKTDKAPQEKASEDKQEKESQWRPIEVNIVKYTNEQRVKRGLKPLQIDPELMKTARRHASWMARTRRFVHAHLGVAENIAMGQRDSQSVVRAWMNSKGHRANMLNRGNTRIGVAAYRTAGGTIYWCQQFRR